MGGLHCPAILRPCRSACQCRPGHPKLAVMSSLSILTLHGLLVFIGAELIFSLTPGPTVMLISAYGFKGGFATRWRPSPAPRPATRSGM